MRLSCRLLAIGVLYPMPLASMAQEAVPYANSEVTVDWVRGTDFSKYKTYAWGTPNQKATDPNHPLDDIGRPAGRRIAKGGGRRKSGSACRF
jgi:hypothetical protein